jgi:hypothetical protein
MKLRRTPMSTAPSKLDDASIRELFATVPIRAAIAGRLVLLDAKTLKVVVSTTTAKYIIWAEDLTGAAAQLREIASLLEITAGRVADAAH